MGLIQSDKIYNIINISLIHKNMGYNKNCNDQTCIQNCCNFYRTCPDYSYSASSYSECYYYYTNTTSNTTLSAGGISGAAIGGAVGLFVFIIVLVCCVKKCKENKARQQQQHIVQQSSPARNNRNINNPNNPLNITTQQLATDPNLFMGANQASGAQPYIQQPYGQPFAQPYIGQPVMDPYGQQQGYPNLYQGGNPMPYNPNPNNPTVIMM